MDFFNEKRKSKIIKRIEKNFKLYPSIKKHYELAIFDYRVGNNKTGGSDGNALINDPTANRAIKMAEPPAIPAILIPTKNDSIKQELKIRQPLKWINLFEFVQRYAQHDSISQKIFHARYVKDELFTKTIVYLNISQSKYYYVKDELMMVALAAACESKLVKIM